MNRDAQEILLQSLRGNLTVGLLAVLLLLTGVTTWAAMAELSSAIIASGVAVVAGNSKKVQHPEGGIIAELLVDEGQAVTAGEKLVKIDDTTPRAALASMEKRIAQLLVRQARLEVERDGRSDFVTPGAIAERINAEEIETLTNLERRLLEDRRSQNKGQKDRLAEQSLQLDAQIRGLDVQISAKSDEIRLIEKELSGKRQLLAAGAIPFTQVNNLDRNAVRLQGERGQLLSSISATRAKISELQLEMIQVDQQTSAAVSTELRDVSNELATLAVDEASARERLRRTDVRAPSTGIVHLLSIHTVGGVVAPAETLMEIVPSGSVLQVEARILPKDIDQLRVGQTATLHLAAFNRNTTPQIDGTILRLSADLETDPINGASFYRATISVPNENLKHLPEGLSLLPGMPVDVFFTTGDRSVLSYFSKPIMDRSNRLFREE